MNNQVSLNSEYRIRDTTGDEEQLFRAVQNIEKSCLPIAEQEIYVTQLLEVYSTTVAMSTTSVEYFAAQKEFQEIAADFDRAVARRKADLHAQGSRRARRALDKSDSSTRAM